VTLALVAVGTTRIASVASTAIAPALARREAIRILGNANWNTVASMSRIPNPTVLWILFVEVLLFSVRISLRVIVLVTQSHERSVQKEVQVVHSLYRCFLDRAEPPVNHACLCRLHNATWRYGVDFLALRMR
jgi:hypothetical protein